MKTIELKPIEESQRDYEILEARLKKFFRDTIYIPLLKELNLPQRLIKNTAHPNPLMDALFIGRVTYQGGTFAGNFSAEISKELRRIGAKFDRKTSTYQLPASQLPAEVKNVIASQESRFLTQMERLDQKLASIVPDELSQQFKCEDLFDKTIYKADRSFRKNIRSITTATTLTPEQRARISKEWQNNMNLYIRDWTEGQIKELRAKIFEDVMSGARKASLVPPLLKITKTIQGSHEEAVNKAKFLAHQETRLMMSALKQTLYQDAGSHGYIWRCVHRPHDQDPKHHTPGNVRYSHGQLNGKEFRWDSPPVTTNPGQRTRRNHPGQDYFCRCHARPLVRVQV